jgi:putative dehydrogenase
MGLPMLQALQHAGFDAVGFDVNNIGFGVQTDPRQCFDIKTLFTVVRDADQTDDVLFGAQNFIANAPELNQIIVCSTLSPRYVLALRDRVPNHINLIDAPMSGAAIAAQEKRLSFMLGGCDADLNAAQPMFDAMGAVFHRMGAFGAGMQAKVLNNLLAASHTAMTRQVLDWADQAGLDEEKMLALIHTSSGQNWLASGFEAIEFARDGWSPDNSIGILTKDVDAAMDALPANANSTLPQAVRQAIRALQSRPKD